MLVGEPVEDLRRFVEYAHRLEGDERGRPRFSATASSKPSVTRVTVRLVLPSNPGYGGRAGELGTQICCGDRAYF